MRTSGLFFPLGTLLTLAGGLATAGCSDENSTREPSTGTAGAHASSGFETDADGWTITGDAQASHIQPDFNTQGGNPNGLISAVDDVTGGVWYFQAPAKFLGNASATYGRYLDFDLKTTAISSPFASFDVVLSGAGMTLGFDTAQNPRTDAWTTYHVKIDEAAGASRRRSPRMRSRGSPSCPRQPPSSSRPCWAI